MSGTLTYCGHTPRVVFGTFAGLDLSHVAMQRQEVNKVIGYGCYSSACSAMLTPPLCQTVCGTWCITCQPLHISIRQSNFSGNTTQFHPVMDNHTH